jgi:hypothetical protein
MLISAVGQITSWCKVVLEQLIVACLVNKFSSIYGSQSFVFFIVAMGGGSLF